MSNRRPTRPLCKYYDLSCKYRNRFLLFLSVRAGTLSRPASIGQNRLPGYNEFVGFALRDFRHEEFETVWRIDQRCFAPGISYSRLELVTYLQRPGAFALVADKSEDSQAAIPQAQTLN